MVSAAIMAAILTQLSLQETSDAANKLLKEMTDSLIAQILQRVQTQVPFLPWLVPP